MGDPKKSRPKYRKPQHPWQKIRIEEEMEISKSYGLKNKKELWKMGSKIKEFALQAKNLIARTNEQGEKEKAQLMTKLAALSILPEGSNLDAVLGLTSKSIMERRLQTLVFKKGLANSVKQARQLIIHGHIMVNSKKMTAPSYLVPKDEEGTIAFMPNSPMRAQLEENKEETPALGEKVIEK